MHSFAHIESCMQRDRMFLASEAAKLCDTQQKANELIVSVAWILTLKWQVLR